MELFGGVENIALSWNSELGLPVTDQLQLYIRKSAQATTGEQRPRLGRADLLWLCGCGGEPHPR